MKAVLLALLLSACGGTEWRLQSTTPAAIDWTAQYGTPRALARSASLMVVAADRGLYAIKSGGEKAWAVELPEGKRALAADEKMVAISGAGMLGGFDAQSGEKKWEQSFGDAPLSPPAIGGGRVAVVVNNLLVAVDASAGTIAWKQPIAVDSPFMRAIQFSRVAPAIARGQVCAGLAWELNVVDLASGEKGAHEDATGGGVSASLVSDGKSCYFPQSRVGDVGANAVWALEPGPKKFAARWQQDLGSEPDDLGISNLAVAGDAVLAVTNHRVVALDAASGKLRWQVIGRPVSPPSTARGTRAAAHAFTEGLPPVSTVNLLPGQNFAVAAGRVFLPARYEDPQTKLPRDVITMLDEKSGAYLGSLDLGGVVFFDLAVAADGALMCATSAGLRTIKL